MPNKTFKSPVRPADLHEVVAGYRQADVDEMAVPSYTHWNPAIRWLMWQRVALVQQLCGTQPIQRALDYGTGTGVMLPFLSQMADEVVGIDMHILPSTRLRDKFGLQNVNLHKVETLPIPLPDQSIDLITALDVLEHIDELDAAVQELKRILKPGGRLIISGPSENFLYKIGRFVAGFSQRATYHSWNVDAVNQATAKHLKLEARQVLFPFPLPRFFDLTIFTR